MDNTTDFPGKQTSIGSTLAGGVKGRSAQTRRTVAITLWIIGLLAFVGAAVLVRVHPAPWPVDLQTTITVQHLHLPSWVITVIGWPTTVNDPIPQVSSFLLWFVVLSLIGVVVWRRGGSPMPWFVTAIFNSLGILFMWILFFPFDFIIARPRPSSPLIHVFIPEPIPTFPSGHVMFAVVYYGFLLYVSLTKPVSQWRYRWILIPFQLYAVLNILLIGFSRVYEGSHWLTDVLGGYLFGALILALLIFLYRWTLDRLTKRRARRGLEKAAHNQQA